MARPDESTRWFAFLRAINTGDRRLTNAALLAPFEQFGLRDVAAYQAAGNVTFLAHDVDDREAFERHLGETLAEAYGFDVPTFVRSAGELATAVDPVPFSEAELAGTEGRVQIVFLRREPPPATVAEALALAPADDTVVFAGRHWLWLPRAGVSTSALPVSRIERLVGPMTMRTVGTVRRMLAKFSS